MESTMLIRDVVKSAENGHPMCADELCDLVGLLPTQQLRAELVSACCGLAEAVAADRAGDAELRKEMADLKERIERLLGAAARVGVLIRMRDTPTGQRALVGMEGGTTMDLSVGTTDAIAVGDEVGVVSGQEGAFVSQVFGRFLGGSDVEFVGRENGHIILREREREEKFRAIVAPTLNVDELVEGESIVRAVRFGLQQALALDTSTECVNQDLGLLGPMRSGVSFADIRGIDSIVDQVATRVRTWYQPQITRQYNLNPERPVVDLRRGILLAGPPGTGKTYLTYAALTYARDLLGPDVPGFAVSASRVLSHWFGQSPRNIRKLSEAANRIGSPGCPALLAWQDFEGIVVGRREADNSADTRVTSAVNEILDAQDRDWVPMATANVPDLIDSAVRDRWYVIHVPMPDESGVRAILADKLTQTVTSDSTDATVEAVIGAMRGDYLKVTVAGQVRDYERLDLLTGRKIVKAVETAAAAAAVRDLEFGARKPGGITAEDLTATLHGEFDSLTRAISPKNASSHLPLTIEEAEQVTHVHAVPRRAAITDTARFVRG